MIEFLDHIDKSVFLLLNGFHNPFFDHVMFWATKSLVWLPLYIYFLFFVIRKFKWNTILILLFTGLMILCTDQLSNIVKEGVHRFRPSQQPGLMVHLVDAYKGGMYGFFSAHAINTSSVVVFLMMILGRKYFYVYVPAILWSVFISYTRIYLGVHYPGDIIVGWIAGSLAGFLFGKGAVLIYKSIDQSVINNAISSDSK